MKLVRSGLETFPFTHPGLYPHIYSSDATYIRTPLIAERLNDSRIVQEPTSLVQLLVRQI
jgi:hypothetical protein